MAYSIIGRSSMHSFKYSDTNNNNNHYNHKASRQFVCCHRFQLRFLRCTEDCHVNTYFKHIFLNMIYYISIVSINKWLINFSNISMHILNTLLPGIIFITRTSGHNSWQMFHCTLYDAS